MQLRDLLQELRIRDRMFPRDLAHGPAFPMLLDLYAAAQDGRRVSITSLCIASYAPATTALRYIDLLLAAGLIERVPDWNDRRRVWMKLTRTGLELVGGYLEAVGKRGLEVAA